MAVFTDALKEIGLTPYRGCPKYSGAGKTYSMQNDDYDGIYWYYETDHFIMDIHDLFIKREYLSGENYPDMRPYMSFISSYIKTANGECISRHLKPESGEVTSLFFETRELVTRPMEKLANAIMGCAMTAPAAELFFEAKAKEWLSITLDAYFKKLNAKPISPSDESAIEDVANYINGHYALDLSQELLERIAMMSGTKLKQVFRQKYQMGITEYTQRKRMNIAEILLSTTELDIKTVAKSVGYSSHSRFSALFYRYKGMYPRDVRGMGAIVYGKERPAGQII